MMTYQLWVWRSGGFSAETSKGKRNPRGDRRKTLTFCLESVALSAAGPAGGAVGGRQKPRRAPAQTRVTISKGNARQ